MKPSIGRIIHRVSDDGLVHEAGIVTRVWNDNEIDVHIFPPGITPPFPYEHVVRDEYAKPGTWHFPEIV